MYKKGKVLPSVLLLYAVCFLFRVLECFILRIDQTVLGEAFIHKLIGILILFLAVKHYRFSFREIGFAKGGAFRGVCAGLALGLLVFVPVYLAESTILMAQGRMEGAAVYVSAYAVNGSIGKQSPAEACKFFYHVIHAESV